jgi:hypothetical protein
MHRNPFISASSVNKKSLNGKMEKIFDWRNQFWGHQFRRRKRRMLHFCESVLPRGRQYLTPSFRNPLKQRGKLGYCKPAQKALLLKGHRWVALFLR